MTDMTLLPPASRAPLVTRVGAPQFPVDLLLCRPEALQQRYAWGDPFIRDAMDHGEVLHG